ncbi:neuronal calcium sensor [Balamuthia mandrillaris]
MGGSLTKEQKELVHRTPFQKKEIKHIKALFDQAIKDRTREDCERRERQGIQEEELSREEFRKVFQTLSKHNFADGADTVDLDEIFDSMDVDGNGHASFSEVVLWLAVYQKGSVEDKLKHMFAWYDADDSGTLEASEIGNVLEVLKLSMTERGFTEKRAIRGAAELVTKLDEDKDGVITLDEWVRVGKQVGLVEELLGSDFLRLMDDISSH